MRSKLFSVISSTSAIALALYLAPVLIDHNSNLNLGSTTFAKDGNSGGGNGGGNGGGHGGGNNGGGHSADNGEAHSPGHDKDEALQDSLQGNLNAAHASTTARKNAESDSMVGKIATYEAAVLNGQNESDDEAAVLEAQITTEAEAIKALKDISNKDVDSEVVTAVNELLDLDEELAEEPES